MGLPTYVYAVVDSFEIANEMWKRIQSLKKGIEIGIQEKSIILFDELEKFTSTEGETIAAYFERFYVLINDLDRNKFTPTTIHTNLKFLNHLQPKWENFITREETGIPLTTEHHDYLSYEPDKEVEEEELNYNYLFMTKLQPTSFNNWTKEPARCITP
ncbi:hypothetical protein Tco_0962906 [Tanacetum coccineum]